MHKIKISIRVSILTIFALLLIAIGSLIISVNYYAGNAILLGFSKTLITGASYNLKQQITTALTPMYERIEFGTSLIKNNLIDPTDSSQFKKFLLQLLDEQPTFAAAHWSTPDGSFHAIERGNRTAFIETVISCPSKSAAQCKEITRQLDEKGNVISKTTPCNTNFNLHSRPWYIKTIKAKHFSISDLYMFYLNPGLGLTATDPIYDKQQHLAGVLGTDIRLQSIADFVANLKLTPNSNIFIFTEDNTLIAAKNLQNQYGTNTPKLSDIKIPWVTAATDHYKNTGENLFIYDYANKQYLAHYESIQGIMDSPWHIAIVLPVSDITATLTRTLTNAIIIAIIALLIGILVVSIVAKNIAKPIVNLTTAAKYINNLELDKVKYTARSHIKEISFLQEAFIAMKQSLSSFIRYVPFTLVKKLITTGDIANVGGESKDVTFLFVDIQGFTTISEEMEPQTLTKYLSAYLEAMTKIILANQGTLDKYIGDGIMAFWGAPTDDNNHALHACKCAMDILNELKILNQHWQQTNNPIMKIRIGIHSGVAVIGNIGSKDRLSYTAIGDNVNLASRIENLNRLYGTTIIVSGATYELVKNDYLFRYLDSVIVRGKHRSADLYELITNDHPLHTLNVNIKDYSNEFSRAFSAYQKGDWSNAIELFRQLAKNYQQDNLAEIFLERCNQLQHNMPTDWDGIWRIT